MSGAVATGGVVVGATVALVTAIKAGIEFGRQGTQKRAEQFFELRGRLKNTPSFQELASLLDMSKAQDPEVKEQARVELAKVPFSVKRDYLGLFEEVALSVNSGLMRKEVAHYMFGYYALICESSPEFWGDVNRFSPYWSLFMTFCADMQEVRDSWAFDRGDLVF